LIDYLEYLKRKYPTLENGQYYSLTFFGDRSMMVSNDMEDLINFLKTGGSSQSLTKAINEHDIKEQENVISGVAIVKIDDPWKWHAMKKEERARNEKRNWTVANRKRKEELNKRGNELLRELYRLRKRNTNKEYMDRLKKNDPLRYENILEANRKRSKKYNKKIVAQRKAVNKAMKAAEKAMKKAGKNDT
jgi:hypothetical protein